MNQFEFGQYQFASLTNQQLFNALRLRCDVFVVEQQCIYPDLDDKDALPDSIHVLSESTDNQRNNNVIAYARCLAPGVSYKGCSIGRVVVAGDMRGHGIAKQLMLRAIEICRATWPKHTIQIGAQVYLQSFYESLGFEAFSAPYDEDGIMHIDMQLRSLRSQ